MHHLFYLIATVLVLAIEEFCGGRETRAAGFGRGVRSKLRYNTVNTVLIIISSISNLWWLHRKRRLLVEGYILDRALTRGRRLLA